MTDNRWGFIFLFSDNHLSLEEKLDVADEAVDMYLKGEDKRNVKFENSEGQVYTKGKYGMLGCYGGQIFNAEIDTPTGFSKLAFLVNEQTGTEYGNSGYLN